VDPNYTIDEKGELHYLFGKKEGGKGSVRVHNRKEKDMTVLNDISSNLSPQPKPLKGKKRRSTTKKDDWDNGDEDDSGNFSSWTTTKRSRSKKQKDFSIQDINPLPGFIDPITLDEIVKPAISPYGHVMGYNSWTQCLGTKNICPMTKKPLSKRELVVLTIDNIELYRYVIFHVVIK
jgi:hypothetical protein